LGGTESENVGAIYTQGKERGKDMSMSISRIIRRIIWKGKGDRVKTLSGNEITKRIALMEFICIM
jgi:hypothetical protein